MIFRTCHCSSWDNHEPRNALLTIHDGHASPSCPTCGLALAAPETEDGPAIYSDEIPVRITWRQDVVPADSYSGTEIRSEWIDVEAAGPTKEDAENLVAALARHDPDDYNHKLVITPFYQATMMPLIHGCGTDESAFLPGTMSPPEKPTTGFIDWNALVDYHNGPGTGSAANTTTKPSS